MLHSMVLGNVQIREPASTPEFLRPLVEAATCGADLTAAVSQITTGLGFDNFMQGISLTVRPNAETQSYVFTTLPLEWVALYDQRAYLEVDPRIQNGIHSSLPYIWDASSLRGSSPGLDQFLDDAARYGVGSGVSISFRGANGWGCLIALSSREDRILPGRRAEIANRVGDVLLFGQFFHELVMAAWLEKKLRPVSRGAALSHREKQCLSLAANGMTSADIAIKLGITERTVNFHFSNLVTKLDALNRNEAIAKAIARGIIPAPL